MAVIKCELCGAVIRNPQRLKKQRFCDNRCRINAWKANQGDAEAERDRLKKLAAERCREELVIARWAALMCCREYGAIIVSHVRAWLEERDIRLAWSLNWPGSLFQSSDWFVPTGARRTTFHLSANARKVNEYRLSEAGRVVLRVLGHERWNK